MHCPLCATETHTLEYQQVLGGQVAIFGRTSAHVRSCLTSVPEFALSDSSLGRTPGFEKKRWYGAHGSKLMFSSPITPSVLVGHEQQVPARQATQIELVMCIALDFSSVVVHAFEIELR